MSTVKISAVVPVYNVEQYLDRCIKSLQNQTFDSFEIILVDDGSTDKSGQMCDAYAKEDPRIQVLHKENGGQSSARNAGQERATGEYVLFVDSDDFVSTQIMEKLYALARKYQADVVCGGICNCYKGRNYAQYEKKIEFTCSGVEGLQKALEGKLIPGSACGRLISKKLYTSVSFHLNRLYEDTFYLVDLFEKVNKVAVTTETLTYYWHRENSTTTHRFQPKDMDVINAYEYVFDKVKISYPELLPQAQFRLFWAHFVVLDRIMEQRNYKQIPEYEGVVSYLKKSWKEVVMCPYFQLSRRLAAVALRIHPRLYYFLSSLKRILAREND